jgi:hypothetical protein
MSQKNFRAVDFKSDNSGGFAVRSKRDRVSEIEEVKPTPTNTPVISPDADENDVPQGTVPEVLSWVGDDKDRAQKALDAENENDKPRKSLVSELEEVLSEEDEDSTDSE